MARKLPNVIALPFALEGPPAPAMERLAAILVFRFVDDVEFLAYPGEGVIHVRSASRIGRSDLGGGRTGGGPL